MNKYVNSFSSFAYFLRAGIGILRRCWRLEGRVKGLCLRVGYVDIKKRRPIGWDSRRFVGVCIVLQNLISCRATKRRDKWL